MNRIFAIFFFLLLFFNLNADAQTRKYRYRNRTRANNTTQTVQVPELQIDETTELTPASSFKLFTPLTYYRSLVHKNFDMDEKTSDMQDEEVDAILMRMYLHRPDLVSTTEAEIQDVSAVSADVQKPEIQEVIPEKKQEVEIMPEITSTPLPTLIVERPNFWKLRGDYYLQFLQNYISDNWYKGGESNYSFVASTVLEANYNNKQKITWDNKLELKLGFQTTRGDTLHAFKTSEDLIRYTGKLGVQATKRWYYTLQLITYTQFTRGYKANDPKVYSDFFSPFNLNVSLGMSYKVEAMKKKLTGSIVMSPLAFNYRFVSRSNLAKNYGITDGGHHLEDYGSQITTDLTWQLADNIRWKTRFYAYTTYKRVEMEWENTFTFSFNKYISTNVFIYPRFDDARARNKDYGYFMLKEYASLGFAYSF